MKKTDFILMVVVALLWLMGNHFSKLFDSAVDGSGLEAWYGINMVFPYLISIFLFTITIIRMIINDRE